MDLVNQEISFHQHARPNLFEIDLGAIAQFSRNIRTLVGAKTMIFAALKCNAYGFGLLPVAKTVLDAGIDALSLVDRANAIELRQAGITRPILLYPGAVADEASVSAAETYDLIPTIVDLDSAAIHARFATRPLRVAVKIDVGQERLGFAAENAADAIGRIAAMRNLKVEIVNSHPNVPMPPSKAYLDWQLGRFQAVLQELENRGIHVPVRMIASSKVLAIAPKLTLTGVDPGQMLFGPFLVQGDVPWPTRRQAFKKLSSRLIHVRVLERHAFHAEAPFPVRNGMRLGIVPIGSADGAAQLHAGQVLVRGQRVPVLGCSLEHTRLDLSSVADVAVGDEVVFIGEQEGAAITPNEVAAYRKLARVADLAMAIRPSVPRRYLT